MFKIVKQHPTEPADQRLHQITEILFPQLKLHIDENGTKYHIDYGADSNLDAALNDLQDGYNDQATQDTIKAIADRLLEVRRILEAYNEIDTQAKYYVIQANREDSGVEEIIPFKD
jgi:hypothetical protein